jgi:hypothetical protein
MNWKNSGYRSTMSWKHSAVDKDRGQFDNPRDTVTANSKMNIISLLLASTSLIFLTTACADKQSRAINDAAATMTDCEKIEALVAAHQNGFEKIRFSRQTTNKMDIWRSRYHLVGDRCQIWHWGPGNTDYVCSLISPDEQIARERFDTAKSITRQCLDDNWKLTESNRKIGTGTKAVFARDGNNTVVATHVVETRGLFNTEWATYYFIGDRSDQL